MTPTTIRLRSYARKTGAIAAINFVRFKVLGLSRVYEEKFGTALMSHVKPGDTVWDIGANVGLYTEKFAQQVGNDGKVVAFEPAPACFRTLKNKFTRSTLVQLEHVAVGSEQGEAFLMVDADPLAATHKLATEKSASQQGQRVRIVSGDWYWNQSGRSPNVIKIDVEGFEEQVLLGMENLLHCKDLRAIFCEVHFKLLEERGEPLAPSRIENKLRESGFRTSWLDASHIQALRVA
jgi:FkbM family methyltransferase